MNQKEARELAKEIKWQGYQVHLCGYVGSSVISLMVTDHVTGYTMTIESPEAWAERERLAEVYS